jgi:hypothetical protein
MLQAVKEAMTKPPKSHKERIMVRGDFHFSVNF